MSSISTRNRTAESPERVSLAPLGDTSTFADRAYRALREVIVSLDVYGQPGEMRLDERRLAQDLGISRTLEREGFVRSIPRRGVYVVRKTKREVIEMITAWAALESMAARLITLNAADEEIARLHAMFTTFENGQLHKAIIAMSHNRVLIDLAENLFAHMRIIRRKTIGEEDRADRSIRDHMNIIQALENRETDRAETLVRQHALGLAEHVARHADYLD